MFCLILISQFYDSKDDRDEEMVATILWHLDVLPAPAAHTVQPTKAADDKFLPPLDLDYRLSCNCFSTSSNSYICLRKFTAYQQLDPDEQEYGLEYLLLDDEETVNTDDINDDQEIEIEGEEE